MPATRYHHPPSYCIINSVVKNIVAFFLFSSIFISSCAVAFCVETNVLLHLPLKSISFYCFVFGTTLAQYNLHYLIKTTAVQHSQRLQWSFINKTLHKILLGTGISLVLFSFLSFRLHHFIVLGVLGIVAFLYSYPLIPAGRKKRIKDFGLLKIMTLALMWTIVTAWFPVVNFSFNRTLFSLIFFARFVFMFVLCLLFDIRDIEIDRQEHINTVAVRLGQTNSYRLANYCLLLFVGLSLACCYVSPDYGSLTALLISAGVTFAAIAFTKNAHSDFVYLAGIDGMMIVQALLVVLFS